jgi:hypothetical protein
MLSRFATPGRQAAAGQPPPEIREGGVTQPAESDAYRRGREEGEVLARLAGHDEHFSRINGSIEGFRAEMHALVVSLQRYSDAADARDVTAAATAKALAEAESARRQLAENRWSGFQRLFAAIAAVAALITIAGVVYTIAH